MGRHLRHVTILFQIILVLGIAGTSLADPAQPDTTWVQAFDEEFINWATPHVADFQFPDQVERFDEVLLYMTIGCPSAPGDCDPWDRLGWLRIMHYDEPDSTESQFEIARFITPYDITGGAGPGTCTWVMDVSDYKFLLTDMVRFRLYIESWIGGDRGWLITCNFAFIHGASEIQPYKVINLWTQGWAEYGNPDNPIEDRLQPVYADIPSDAIAGKVRSYVTGHGQGNTINCAEFCPREHSVVAADETFSHTLWRYDCAQNVCSPQGGTWVYNRAGWCPGDKADPWDNDVTHLLTPGAPMLFDYNVQDYFNACGPHNPDCVDGQTCPDCDYNYTGHTQPGYTMNVQLILYRSDPTAAPGVGQAQRPVGLELGRNYPNPFNPRTTFYYTLAEPGEASLIIYSAGGREIQRIERRHEQAGTYWYQWNGTDAQGQQMSSGVYFYEVRAGGESQARKMIMLQ